VALSPEPDCPDWLLELPPYLLPEEPLAPLAPELEPLLPGYCDEPDVPLDDDWACALRTRHAAHNAIAVVNFLLI